MIVFNCQVGLLLTTDMWLFRFDCMIFIVNKGTTNDMHKIDNFSHGHHTLPVMSLFHISLSCYKGCSDTRCQESAVGMVTAISSLNYNSFLNKLVMKNK